MKILGYHISDNTIITSDGNATTTPPYLEFLLKRQDNTIRVLYHIGYNVANLIEMIGITEEQGKELLRTTELYIPPYRLKYIPNKFLSIKKGNEFVTYCDASQYYKYPNDYLQSKSPIELAKLAQQTGQNVYNAITELGIKTESITSPVRAYEKAVLEKLDLPTIDDIPEEAGEYAFNCCKSNWVEAFKLGFFQTAYDFDVNFGYPSQIAKLHDTREGIWTRIDKVDMIFMPFSIYGYWKCKVKITARFSPIIYVLKGRSYTPTGRFETYLTTKEIEFIEKHNIGKVEIIDGWRWIPSSNKGINHFPMEQQIKWLYNEKEKATGIKKDVIKRIGAGIYGKFIEQHPEVNEFGTRFNPVWAAEIETNTRLQVAEFAIQNDIIPIHVAVDGIVTDKKIEVNSQELGEWRLNKIAPCISIGSGTVAMKDDKGSGDFTLDYDWLKESIESNPEEKTYKITRLSPITLAVAINEKKWNKLGELKWTTKTVDIGYEEKRRYEKMPWNGKALMSGIFDSKPLDIGMIIGKEFVKGE